MRSTTLFSMPQSLQIVGDLVAILWEDGVEHYIPHPVLRAESPSAVNKGERDIFGNKYGGDTRTEFPDVRVQGWHYVGNYAIRIEFSDGHNTGLFSWKLLRELGEKQTAQSETTG